MRVRIASRVYNSSSQDSPSRAGSAASRAKGTGYDTNIFDDADFVNGVRGGIGEAGNGMDVDIGNGMMNGTYEHVSAEEQKVLDRVGEDLARLGRVKRVGLGVEDKIEFVRVWGTRRR